MKDYVRLNLYDRFFVAGILKGMDMIGQTYGLSILIMGSKVLNLVLI